MRYLLVFIFRATLNIIGLGLSGKTCFSASVSVCVAVIQSTPIVLFSPSVAGLDFTIEPPRL